MPEAKHVVTRNPSANVAGLSLFCPASGEDGVTFSARCQPNEHELLMACQAVAVRSESTLLLGQAVADLPPTDPRHGASYALIDRIRRDWIARLDRVATISALGHSGLTAKAAFLASLIERDDDDRVQGPPALRIAASLADDLLALGSG